MTFFVTSTICRIFAGKKNAETKSASQQIFLQKFGLKHIQNGKNVIYFLTKKEDLIMPKIKVIRPTEEIKKELAELEENIQTAAASIKEMKTTRRTLRKELELAQAKEAEEKQADEIKELTELMKEKGVTVEYLKSLMQ